MNTSFLQLFIGLITGIAFIVFCTTRWRMPPFFALMIAGLITGSIAGISPGEIITIMKDGFGNIMKSLGFIIVLGTSLGVLLEHTGSTGAMANYILKKTGEKHAAVALSITGFIVGLPVFCDSGYIVLSGLNNFLIKRTGIPAPVMSVSLATGLYSVHCLLPPHPGAAAAAGTIGVDFGRLMLYGLLIAIPAAIAGHWWAVSAGRKLEQTVSEETTTPGIVPVQPSAFKAFLPVLAPIVLIAAASFLHPFISPDSGLAALLVLGDPVVALSIGILLALAAIKNGDRKTISRLLGEAAEKGGSILVIIGAGGAFGAVLAATKIGDHAGAALALDSMGLFFPFLLACLLKTAQGSSTVAIITAASVVQPLLHALHLDTDNGRLIAVLAMGAGAMMISHANDAYFWVISKFSGIGMNAMLKVYSVATVWMGLISLLMVYLLSLLLL